MTKLRLKETLTKLKKVRVKIGLYKSEEGVILVAMTYTVCFLILIWLTTRNVKKIDKRRHLSEEALKESHEKLTILSEISYQLLINEDPQKLIKKVCYRIMDFLDCQVFFNFLVDDHTGKLYLNAYAGISSESAKSIEWLEFGEAVCGFVAANGEPIVAENIPETTNPRTELIKSFGVKTYACYPLLSQEKVIGTVSFGSNTRLHFSNDDLSLMKVFADQVATFIRRINYEIALHESEERFRALAESSPVGMGVVGIQDANFLYVNPAYEQYFGYDKDELLNKKAPDIYWDPNDRELIFKKLDEDNFVSNFEVKLRRKNGSSFWSMSSIRPIKFLNKPAFLGVFIDISKRKEAEEALINSEQRLKYHFENSPLAIVEWNKDYHVIEWSNEAERIFGWKKEEVVGKRIDTLDLVYEDDIPILEKTMERLSGGKESKVVSSNRNYTRSREIRECVWYNSVLLNESGQMSSVMSLVDDVTEIRIVEKLLKESEGKLRSVLNATQESIYMFDREGRFTMANSTGLRRLNGISEQELIGRHFSEFMPVTQARQRQSKLDIVFKTGEPLEFEDSRNGLMFHHNFFPLFNENGVSHVVSYSTDITLRKQADKELQSTKDYLENLINFANAPIIVWNPDREIRLFNHAFERLTGYTSAEVDGKKIDLLFPRGSLKESNIKIKAALIENWKTIEIPIQTKQGDIRTVLWNSANIYDADKKTVLSTIAQGNDITERIQAEQKVKERTKDLELANKQLQQELKERYLAQAALKKSEAQLKELNATKDKFFNIVAHDLKNPFTSLLGSSELLFRNIDQMDNEKIKTLSLILNDSAKNGFSILQNLLDWSRSQTGLLKFNPEKINLKKLIRENIANLQLLAANKNIDVLSEVVDDSHIFADKNMINTILRNLLSNSIKFTRKGGKVVVSAIINSDEAIISVKDTGIGISKENIDKLFRIDVKYSMPGTDNEQGTGLGLKLSREFVEKQGGKIWVESVENCGSDFKFTIPLKGN